MTDSKAVLDPWRTQPLYTYAEAGRLTGVSTNTVKNWLFGYDGKTGVRPPLFQNVAVDAEMVSFLQMVEILVASRFRKSEGVPFRTVHRAYDNATKLWGIDYPFAHLRLKALGGHIVQALHDRSSGNSVQSLDEPAQWSLPGLVRETVGQLDYEEGWATCWYPVGKDHPMVVNPRITAGEPTIARRGVTVRTICNRFRAGQAIAFIADDFELEHSVVEDVIRFADRMAA